MWWTCKLPTNQVSHRLCVTKHGAAPTKLKLGKRTEVVADNEHMPLTGRAGVVDGSCIIMRVWHNFILKVARLTGAFAKIGVLSASNLV
jgi:hypothetical protein